MRFRVAWLCRRKSVAGGRLNGQRARFSRSRRSQLAPQLRLLRKIAVHPMFSRGHVIGELRGPRRCLRGNVARDRAPNRMPLCHRVDNALAASF
jgi:hypothetical protein